MLIEWLQLSQLFHDEGPFHVETSPLICSVNQWTGFYMKGTSFMKELLVLCYFHLFAGWTQMRQVLPPFSPETLENVLLATVFMGRSIAVSNLRSETKGSRFESGC